MRCKYYCDYCGMAFDTEEECKEHEVIELAEKEKERKRKASAATKAKIAELAKRDDMTDEDFVKELDELTKDMRPNVFDLDPDLFKPATFEFTTTTPMDEVKKVFDAGTKASSLSHRQMLDNLSSSIDKMVDELRDRIEKKAEVSASAKEDSEPKHKVKATTTYWVDGKEVDKDTFKKTTKDCGWDFGDDDNVKLTDIAAAIRDLF